MSKTTFDQNSGAEVPWIRPGIASSPSPASSSFANRPPGALQSSHGLYGAMPSRVQMNTTGQIAPQGVKPRVTATLWKDEGTRCFQVDVKGTGVARREDNHMINGTKLLNVAGMTRSHRDAILKAEKQKHVVKIGPMHLKGVWIPFERALEFANKEKITEMLYPLFAHDIAALLYKPVNHDHPQTPLGDMLAAGPSQGMNMMRPPTQENHLGGVPPRAPTPSASGPHLLRDETFNNPESSLDIEQAPSLPEISSNEGMDSNLYAQFPATNRYLAKQQRNLQQKLANRYLAEQRNSPQKSVDAQVVNLEVAANTENVTRSFQQPNNELMPKITPVIGKPGFHSVYNSLTGQQSYFENHDIQAGSSSQPAISTAASITPNASSFGTGQTRADEHPIRQSRGPPFIDELQAKLTRKYEGHDNFAARKRRTARGNIVESQMNTAAVEKEDVEYTERPVSVTSMNQSIATNKGVESLRSISEYGIGLSSITGLRPDGSSDEELANSRHSSETTDETNITRPNSPEADDINDLINIDDDDDESVMSEYEGDERIRNPGAYFRRLASLEAKVYLNSDISDYKEFKGRLAMLSYEDFDAVAIGDSIIEKPSPEFVQFLQCRQLLDNVCQNLRSLQLHRFCLDDFSLIVQDPARADVAQLRRLNIQTVVDLRRKMRGTEVRNSAKGDLVIEKVIELVPECNRLLTSIGLNHEPLEPNENTAPPPSGLSEALEKVSLTVRILELTVMSFAGAHIERFDQKFLKLDVDVFQIPHSAISDSICTRLRRRKLACLDKFLGGADVWVFHQDANETSNDRLLLSTDIKAIADIWGPLWQVTDPSTPSRIQQYNVGNGFIIPWSRCNSCPSCRTNATKPERVLADGEVFCHWISSKEWDPEHIALHQTSISKHFSASDRLLIGAATGFTLNKQCIPTADDLLRVKGRFLEEHALRPPNVSAPRRYADSQAVQLQASVFSLLSVSGTTNYKRQSGMTMKDALVERWRNRLDRNPGDLEAFGGLEVSLCTRNALRTRLLDVLRSRTMKNYLKSVNFEWVSMECEEAYFAALKGRRSFRNFWAKHSDWRNNVGDAISLCLDKLQNTGIDQDNRQLDALWVEAFDSPDLEDDEDDATNSYAGSCSPLIEPWTVSLFRSEHTWTGMVKDSLECFTMAVMVIACLDYDDECGFGRRCCGFAPNRDPGYSVLKTAITLNKAILKDEGFCLEKSTGTSVAGWNSREVKKGTCLHLGDHGTLKVLRRLKHSSMLEVEWKPLLSETAQEVKNVAGNQLVLGRGVDKHHQEYIQGVSLDLPLKVLVLSGRMEPFSGKT